MIYLSDDYVSKYQDALGYIVGRAISEGFAPRHIEKAIAYSSPFSMFEKSNITDIAFSSYEKLYETIFDTKDINEYRYNPYDCFGWLGYTYIRLFFDLRITFEALFVILPIDKAINMYHLYHEMDYRQTLEAVKESIKYTIFDVIMKTKNISTKRLSELSNVSVSTISSLRYGNRDINKLEVSSCLKIANALNVKTESLLTDINLIFEN